MITRNPHRDDAGYRVGYRTGPVLPTGKRGWVTVYLGEEQGCPEEDGGRWAVVCQVHSSLVQTDTLADARTIAQYGSEEFCDCCAGTCIDINSYEDYACPTCGAVPRRARIA